MKAIDKGDSSLKKGQSKGKAPARTKRKEFPDASPKAVTKKPKKVQPKKKVPISDADAIGLPLRRSDRRSSMTTYSESTSEEDEGDMQDEEDVEDEDDRENVDPSPSPEKTPVPQHRRGPASKSKIEFLADDTASLDVRDDNYEDNDEDILGLSSIPKRKTQVDMELDFLSSPPSLLSKKIRRM